MRNGNTLKGVKIVSFCQLFLSYLWGMETVLVWLLLLVVQFLVLILPMRNGNLLFLLLLPLPLYVLILPMRNGNYLVLKYQNSSSYLPPWFLSYLWGMETYFWYYRKYRWTVFLSYLWGMETQNISIHRDSCVLFLSYLWGMETMKYAKR